MMLATTALLVSLISAEPSPNGADSRRDLEAVEIERGQILRLEATGTGSAPCHAWLRFVDRYGHGVGPSHVARLTRGISVTLELFGDMLIMSNGHRTRVRPVLVGYPMEACKATATLVDDATGVEVARQNKDHQVKAPVEDAP